MNNTLPKSELNMALQSLLEALKDYNRALVMVKQEGDALVKELINHLEVESMGEPDSDYYDQVGDRTTD